MLRRALLTACLLIVPVSAAAKTTREADLAHREARTAHVALKKDTARRKFRHHWLNVADKYEGVARGHPKTDRAPEALFAAGQMLEELSRISRNPEDLLRAASDYRKVVELAPRHALADDAALEVARIQSDLLGRPEDARRTAERALKQLPRGDKTRELRALLAALPADKRRKAGGEGKSGSREPRAALLAAMARMGTQESARPPETPPGTGSSRVPALDRRAEDVGGAAPRESSSPGTAEAASGGRGVGQGGLRADRGEGQGSAGARSEQVRSGPGTADPRPQGDPTGPREGVERGAHGERAEPREATALRADRGGERRSPGQHAPGTAEASRGEERASGRGTPASEPTRDGARGPGRASGPAVPPEGRDGSAPGAPGPVDALEGRDRSGATGGGDPVAERAVPAGERGATLGQEGPGAAGAHVEIPRDLPVVRAAPKSSEPEPAPEKRLGAREARARLKAMGGVKDAEVTLAEQLGLKVRRVIIDPGHGGHDSGALGPSGKKEKDVSLAISRKLAARLRAEGLEVLLTRERDTFVRLEDRAQFANDHRGDLFISVHCNSATSRKLRGVETYSLNIASDRYSIRLAARENASSEKSISDLQFILADLATKANTEESTHLATRVQKALVESLAAKDAGLRDLGHKQALFYVLLGAKMPAILVETSFISNPEDERRLASAKYQDQVAAAIADGVRAFLDNRDRVAQVE